MVAKFERTVADYVGAKDGVATVNGTAALHLALRVVGVTLEDEVLVSTLTFIASANAIHYCGAHPVFMDSDEISWNMDPQKLSDFVRDECRFRNNVWRNKTSGRRIAAIVPVHILGHPVDMDPILDVARRYQIPTVEDGAESLGARYKGRSVGSIGDVTCFSFNGNKIVTTGGGGMIVTNNQTLAEAARHLVTQARTDPIEFVHDQVGYNYRLPSLNAALGVAQMEQLESFVKVKRDLGAFYRAAFKEMPGVTFMPEARWAEPTYWVNTILLDRSVSEEDRTRIIGVLNSRSVQAQPRWRPLHRLPVYRGEQAYRVETANDLYRRAISLPSSVALTEAERSYVVERVREALAP